MRFALLKGACCAGAAALSLPCLTASAAMAQEVASDEAPVADRQADVPKPWQPLADDGVTLALSYTGEAATNVTGGLRRDAAYAGQIYIGADLDMDRIAGIGGGTIHAAITNRHGESLSALALGNNTSVQEIWGTQNTHLAILTWEQKLFNDRLMIEAGRSQANIHFLNSPIYCNFQGNSGCGNPTFVFKNSNFTYFPASSWMIRAKAEVLPHVTVHVGAYEVNPDRKRASDHGFNFSTKNATGVIVPWELGYSNEGKGVRLPGHYIVGGWFDRGDYADPLRDDQGGIAILTGRDPQTRKGRSGLYFRFDQRLTRPDPRSERGLSVFGVAMTNLSGRVEESRFLDFGVVQTGTLAGRDADTIGFMISDQRFSNLAMERMRAARVSAGGDAAVSRHQYMMELAYGAQLGPAIRISPNVQYILHPDQTGAPFRTRDIKDALIFGFKFTIDAPTLLSGGR
ncbi:carbohydrate porin [Novosphingobium sp. ST904]|uniref:carbohydrate porin n=1 Tax=Novosphingobium sp. ST904 TaxID=1684385 RepID=UPI0006C876FF|nr:carbohydrate porin [Novosphingobium sp. ST904]KPH62065.1 porin [Novosphingobium sp. ST904]TCM33122.1 OprB family porin [Novosphingobium sp. ST904]